MIQIDLREEADLALQRKMDALTSFRTPLAEAQLIMVRSINRNFTESGRPQKWQPLAPSTIANRPHGGTKPLIDEGNLRAAIGPGILTDAESTVTSGGVRYAAIQHHGGTVQVPEITPTRAQALSWIGPGGTRVFAKRVQAHSVTIPARPYMLFQVEDVQAIVGAFETYVGGA